MMTSKLGEMLTSRTLVLVLLRFLFYGQKCYVSAVSTHTLIDASGAVSLHNMKRWTTRYDGVVTIINPEEKLFSTFVSDNDGVVAHTPDGNEGCVVLTTPGANAIPPSIATAADDELAVMASGKVVTGYGCACASIPAGVILLNGFEPSDFGRGNSWRDSRLGRTLSCIFASHVAAKMGGGEVRSTKPLILLGVSEPVTSLTVQNEVLQEVESLYQEVIESARLMDEGGEDDIKFESLDDTYDVGLRHIGSEDDLQTVMNMAMEEAPSRSPEIANVASVMSDTFSGNNKLLQSVLTTPRFILVAMQRCDDAYARHSRAVRAKMTQWKHRVSRDLTVDKFGSQASTLYQNTLKNYDYETMAVSGGASASYRLRQRAKLQFLLGRGIQELFDRQIDILENNSVQSLQRRLLRLRKKDAEKKVEPSSGSDAEAAVTEEYNENAAAVRSAAFEFDTRAADLEVPPLSLYKERYSQDVRVKLHETLAKFPDSPAAQFQDMKRISKAASRKAKIKKKKRGTEPSIDFGLALVAMFRPDGYGNLQGFAGYNLGPHSVTVGVQNDADDPQTITQFGGVRPPFLRVQPKLDVNVEL